MEEKKLTYINFTMFIILIVVVFIIFRPIGFVPKKVEIKTAAVKPIVPQNAQSAEPAIYDIDKIKTKDQKTVNVDAKDLAEVYANYPEEDVGSNIMKNWADADPKDKKDFMDGLDKQIDTHKETVKLEPENKKARNLLKMSETLKKLAQNNFNYKVKVD